MRDTRLQRKTEKDAERHTEKIYRNKERYRKRERCTDRVITERGEEKTSLNTWISSDINCTPGFTVT